MLNSAGQSMAGVAFLADFIPTIKDYFTANITTKIITGLKKNLQSSDTYGIHFFRNRRKSWTNMLKCCPSIMKTI